jgi:hypothetical protein
VPEYSFCPWAGNEVLLEPLRALCDFIQRLATNGSILTVRNLPTIRQRFAIKGSEQLAAFNTATKAVTSAKFGPVIVHLATGLATSSTGGRCRRCRTRLDIFRASTMCQTALTMLDQFAAG